MFRWIPYSEKWIIAGQDIRSGSANPQTLIVCIDAIIYQQSGN